MRDFAPFLKEMHFADRDYFRTEIEKQTPLYGLTSQFRLRSMEWETSPVLDEKYAIANWIMRDQEPLTRRENYSFTRRELEIVMHKQNSLAVFESLPELGIFFYRGDSSEGGNVAWLSANQWQTGSNQPAMLTAVLDKLADGGLLVTDGSRIEDKPSEIAPLAQFSNQNVDVEADQVAPFQAFGRRFQLLGTLKPGRRPTLVWRVEK